MQAASLILAAIICATLYLVSKKTDTLRTSRPRQAIDTVGDSCRACILFLLIGFSANLLVLPFAADANTTLRTQSHYFQMLASDDSWASMIAAIKHLRDNPESPVYSSIFFEQKIKFQYPTSSLLLLDFSQNTTGASWESMMRLLNMMSWICVLATSVAVPFIFNSALRESAGEAYVRRTRFYYVAGFALPFLLVLCSYPILRGFTLGQIQSVLTLLVALSIIAWQCNKFIIAGILIGLCCAVKPHWLLIILWALLRRHWSMAVSASATAGAIFLLSVMAYGLVNFVDYINVLSFISQHGESFYQNQSVNGLLNRMLFNGDNLSFNPNSFPPYKSMIHAITLISSGMILIVTIVLRVNRPLRVIDFSIAILGLTIASPVAWEHHYGIVLPIMMAALPSAVHLRVLGAWTTIYILVAFLLTSQNLHGVLNMASDGPLNFFQSYIFFGALMTLGLLFAIANRGISGSRKDVKEDGLLLRR